MRTKSFDSTRGSLLDQMIWNMRVKNVCNKIGGRVHMVADLGCGHTAPLLRALLRSGIAERAVGVDIDPAERLAERHLTMVRADLNLPLPLGDGSFDLVLSLAVLEHLTEPVLHLREVRRILKPGGMLLLTTPSPRGKPVLEFLAFRLGVIDRREIEDHKTYFDTRMLRELIAEAGFDAFRIDAQTFLLGMNNSVVVTR